MRAYTVQELNALRELVKMKYLFGTYRPLGGKLTQTYYAMSRSYCESDMVRAVEEQVRTHMLAGHTAADLLSSEVEA